MNDELAESLRNALVWTQAGNDPRNVSSLRQAEYRWHLERIQTAVGAHPILRVLDGKFIRTGSASARISNHLVAIALLRRSHECGEADAAIGDVLTFVEHPRLNVLTVLTLSGIVIDRALDLSPKLRLSPPGLLPQSENWQRFFPTEATRRERSIYEPSAVFPTAALTYSWEIERAITEPNLAELEVPSVAQEEELEFDRAVAALVLCSNEGVQRMQRYHENLHPGHLWPVSGWSEHPATATWREPARIEPEHVVNVFAMTKHFREWSDFSRLVKRLNGARTKGDLVDAHIDLGIVAECALTKGDSKEAEISHRLRTRSAWLLGSDPEERRQIARAMNELYGRRSSGVHRGVIDPTSRQTFDHDDALCRRLLVSILEQGHFPKGAEWSALIYG